MPDQPSLTLVASSEGPTSLPTLDDLVRMFVKLTGRQPSEDDLAKATARIAARDTR